MSRNKQTSEITKKIIKLFEEEGNNIHWPKEKVLLRFKTWQEEIKAEAGELGKILAKGKKSELSEVMAGLSDFRNWQTERQKEVFEWEKKLGGIAQKRVVIEKEISSFLSDLSKGEKKKKS